MTKLFVLGKIDWLRLIFLVLLLVIFVAGLIFLGLYIWFRFNINFLCHLKGKKNAKTKFFFFLQIANMVSGHC